MIICGQEHRSGSCQLKMSLIKNFPDLAKTPARRAVLEIVEAGLEAIQPQKVLDAGFKIQDSSLEAGNEKLDLRDFNRIFLVGFGKGAAGISRIIEEKLGERLTEGWVIDAVPASFRKIDFTLGTHPVPSKTNVDFTRNMLSTLKEKQLSGSDLVLVVVCGGGSAMLTDPVITLSELIKTNQGLLRSGKNIAEMNEVRKKLDRVKSGGLARQLMPAKVLGLIFSDVPGNDLSVIASAPTVAKNATNVLVLSNMTALSAMKKKAEELGYEAEIVTDRLQGEAREAAKTLLDKIKDKRFEIKGETQEAPLRQGFAGQAGDGIQVKRQEKGKKGRVLLAGGETTVTAGGNGQGGRNQELVLGALQEMSNEQSSINNKLAMKQFNNITIVSVDSDGWDNGPVAGAVADIGTWQTCQKLGLDVNAYLENNDSYNFFQKTGDCIVTGRLASNVADLIVVLKT